MKKIDLGKTIQILANVGVIAGIIFLAYEIRQNNEWLAFEARSNATAQSMESWAAVAEQPDLIELMLKDRAEEELSLADEMRLNSWWMRTLSRWQWRYQEFPDSPEFWSGPQRNFRDYGSLRRTWNGTGASSGASKDNFDPGFINFIESEVFIP